MRSVIVSLTVLVLLVFFSPAKADPPSNAERQSETTTDDGIRQTLRTILKRLDSIEKRLSRMEQQLAYMRASSTTSEDVERGMQLDAIERERRLIEPLEEQIRPMDRR